MRAMKPVGFGGIDQVAEFFGVPKSAVRKKAVSGEWPSYVIAGKRVFDIDQILRIVVSDHRDADLDHEEAT